MPTLILLILVHFQFPRDIINGYRPNKDAAKSDTESISLCAKCKLVYQSIFITHHVVCCFIRWTIKVC